MTIFSCQATVGGMGATLACDGFCRKAYGAINRPRVPLSAELLGFTGYLYDDEIAADAPEALEGLNGCAKPFNAQSGKDMTDWCLRHCERSVLLDAMATDDRIKQHVNDYIGKNFK